MTLEGPAERGSPLCPPPEGSGHPFPPPTLSPPLLNTQTKTGSGPSPEAPGRQKYRSDLSPHPFPLPVALCRDEAREEHGGAMWLAAQGHPSIPSRSSRGPQGLGGNAWPSLNGQRDFCANWHSRINTARTLGPEQKGAMEGCMQEEVMVRWS
jgi:hypothetical protein